MKKRTAYVWMAAIVVALVTADYFILTSSATLSRYARAELTKIFGPDLQCREVRASMDGVLVLEDMSLTATPERIKVLSAERVEIRFSDGLGNKPETVLLDAPRLELSDRLFEELAKLPPGPPLRERLPEDLPRIVCRGGTLEVIHGAIFRWDAAQALSIRELVFTPTGPQRYGVSGRLWSDTFGEWRLDGEADLGSERTRVRLECGDLFFSHQIKNVLNPTHHAAWENYQPKGRGAIRVELGKEPGREVDFRLTLQALDMEVTYGGFPYPLEHVRGEIEFRTSGFHIKHLQGRREPSGREERERPTVVHFDGTSEGYALGSEFKFRLQIEDMYLDDRLKAALDDSGKAIWGKFFPPREEGGSTSSLPYGRLSANGWVMRESGPDKKVRMPLQLTFRDTRFYSSDFGYWMNNVEGSIELDGPRVNVHYVRASEPRWKMVPILGWVPDRSTEFDIHGWIDGIDGDPRLYLNIEATAVPLDVRLKEALGPSMEKIWDEFNPGGEIDVEWHVTKEKGNPDPRHRGTATLRRCRSRYKAFSEQHPLVLTEINGEVRYSPEKIEFEHLEGKCADAEIRLHGEQDEKMLKMRLEAVGLTIDSTTRKSMPKDVRELLSTLEVEGRANFDMRLELSKGEKKKHNVWLSLQLVDGRINTEVKIDKIEQARADFVVFIGEKSTDLSGPIRFTRAEIEGKKLQDVSCFLVKEGPVLRFLDLHGLAYGGVVAGSFRINTESKEYGGEFNADRLDLREYAADTKDFASKPPKGRVSLTLRNLRGKGGESGSIRGSGQLVLAEAELWTVPVFLNLLDPLQWGGNRSFTAGTAHFEIENRKFKIDPLAFQGEDKTLLGRGTIDFDGNLDLRCQFKSGSILGIDFFLFKIPVAIIDLFRGALFPIKVKGTFEKPEVTFG